MRIKGVTPITPVGAVGAVGRITPVGAKDEVRNGGIRG